MKINTSYIIAGAAIVGIIGWFLIHSFGDDDNGPAPVGTQISEKAQNAVKADAVMPTVVVRQVTAEDHANRLQLYGRTEANREVQVKAETSGIVVATPLKEGQTVGAGTVMCRQDIDARQANLDQARAMLRTRELELAAAKTLVEKGYRSETQLSTAKAVVDGAIAQVKQAEIELDNVNLRAPFRGVFERQIAEVGDFLAPGQPCGLLVELDPLVVTSELTETQVGYIRTGQLADIQLATGETVQGKVRLIESRANPATRTFRIEMAVDNRKAQLKAGVTADVRLTAGTTSAQKIPSGILTLDDTGIVGVRYLDKSDKVQFATVQTIDEEADGIWVTGLPENTRVIIQGQDFVAVGTQVDPRTSLEDRRAE